MGALLDDDDDVCYLWGRFAATGLYILETASQFVTADKPEITAAFPVSQETVLESNPNLTPNPNPPPHTNLLI